MNWFQSLIPSCCSTRQAQPQNELKKASTFIPEIQISSEPPTPDLDYLEFPIPEKNSEEAMGNCLTVNNFGLKKMLSESRRSTSHTVTSLDIAMLNLGNFYAELLKCKICNREAKGFCPSCPNIRYCADCYPKDHREPKDYHQFIQYSNKKIRPTEVEQLIKVKGLI